MRAEADREFAKLSRLEDHPVYYLALQVSESEVFRIHSSWGGVNERRHSRERLLDLDLRVGGPELDNTHRAAGDGSPAMPVSLEDDPKALQSDIWLEVERRYRDAVDRYIKIVADHAVKVKEEDPSPDFSAEPKAEFAEPAQPLNVDETAWEAEARRLSAIFRKHPDVLESSVQMSARAETRRFVNSEGTSIEQTEPVYEIRVTAGSRAEDGMEFSLYKTYPGRTAAELAPEAKIAADAEEMGRTLKGLKTAPLVDPFVGPAMLSGRAAAVLFHEVLGHRLEGHRQKDENTDQTFTKRLNARILPEFLTVTSDPTLPALAGTPLMGLYKYDDEGVAARPVTLVDHGILKAFMMCRSPVRAFAHSNGHGRKQPGRGAVARQANLIVSASRTMPVAKLRQELIRMCKDRKKPYGLIFEDIEGGFTFTGRTTPNAFNVMPIVVRRVYTDGRPDELVRGVDLIGTPISTLERIVAAGDDTGVFNGYCGAESGYVPVSATAPSLLVAEVEVQRKQKGQDRPPLLPQPAWEMTHAR